jgi:hypothetical protein
MSTAQTSAISTTRNLTAFILLLTTGLTYLSMIPNQHTIYTYSQLLLVWRCFGIVALTAGICINARIGTWIDVVSNKAFFYYEMVFA